MKKHVFISYKVEDFDQANWIKTLLEANGTACWMAPMSIPGGSSYAVEIPKAIRECSHFVLILSKKAQLSKWVSREVDRAINENKTILPFLIENCPLTQEYSFYLTNVQQYPAYADRNAAAQALVRDITGKTDVVMDTTAAPQLSVKKNNSSKKPLIICAVALVAAALAVGAFFLLRGGSGEQPGETKPAQTAPTQTASTATPVRTPVGRYEVFSMTSDDMTLSADVIAEVMPEVMESYILLQEDGTGIWTFFMGESESFTYIVDDGKILLLDSIGDVLEVRWEDDQLIIEIDGDQMVYKKA